MEVDEEMIEHEEDKSRKKEIENEWIIKLDEEKNLWKNYISSKNMS